MCRDKTGGYIITGLASARTWIPLREYIRVVVTGNLIVFYLGVELELEP
jgi:hypothetical protein